MSCQVSTLGVPTSTAPLLATKPLVLEDPPVADGCERIVLVQTLAGNPVAEVSPVPETVELLKAEVCGSTPPALLRIVHGSRILTDTEALHEAFGDSRELKLTLVVDESPYFTWDLENNPQKGLLQGESGPNGSIVNFMLESCDYVNVVTLEPIASGAHYFEFLLHQVGDEQWCGVTTTRARAGYHGSSAGRLYYSGRRSSRRGALHAPEEYRTAASFEHVQSGDVIGLVIDLDRGALVFLHNGAVQGACSVSQKPQYLTTSLDRADDRVELRKLPLAMAPAEALAALSEGDVLQIADPDIEDEDEAAASFPGSDDEM